MELSLPLIAGASAVLFLLWLLLRDFIVRSPIDGLPGPPSPDVVLGHIFEVFGKKGWQFTRDTSETYGPVSKLRAFLGGPMLLVHDPKALHSLLTKDAEFYPKCAAPFDEFMLLLGPSLFTTEGAQHRRQRKQLNPVFSIAHLRNMTELFYDIAHRATKAIEDRVGSALDGEIIDVNGWMARTTLEMLGQAALGYSFDNFIEGSTDAFGESLKAFFPTYSRVAVIGFVVPIISYVMPKWLVLAMLQLIPQTDLQRMLHISRTIEQRSKEIIGEKKMALMKGDDELKHKVGEGKDLMSILLKANMLAAEEERLTDEELVAQMSIFILAGMDTTANALTRTLQVLAQNPEVQERLRSELADARNGNDISYDALDRLTYLDAVCRETLRLYSPVNVIGRAASKDMSLPLLNPVVAKDGTIMNSVPVPTGTWVLANIQASNCSRALWGPDAYEWKPERWLQPAPHTLEDARIPGVYSHLMTFSGGSRSCIGFKFSQLEMKVVLSLLVSSFKFELTDKPISWNTSGVSYPTMSEDSDKPEMLLKVTKIVA
ncbi:cytochrome P450 [Cubamyces sp. BRFM 1775]|nr:cytochrome P450 [Cubamyces sp. BRFM 1775]